MIKKLLHIDDDREDQELFAECIHSINPLIQCTQFTNSFAVLDYIKTKALPQADMIFMDLNMPCVNGLELLRALRRIEEYNNIPVTILTSSSSFMDVDQSKMFGATYFLTKPYTFKEWLENLEMVIRFEWKKI